MANSDSLSNEKDLVPNEYIIITPQNEIPIPQIILTEPPTTFNEETHVDSEKQESDSRHALSLSLLGRNGSSSNKKQTLSPTTPLPLTKDLLQRKNKLDRLLLQKEKGKNIQINQQQHHHNHFSSDGAVDGRVTAGLGISTPFDDNNNSGLRPRRKSSSRQTFSNRSEPEKPWTTYFSQSNSSQYHSDWSYDIDAFKSNTSNSSKERKHYRKSTQSGGDNISRSESSHRGGASMKAYSANHRYMDRNDNRSARNYHYQRPQQNYTHQTNNKQSKHYLLELLYQAVDRVINSRAPESEEMSHKELFDFKKSKQHNMEEQNTPRSSAAYNSFNEKILEASSPHTITSQSIHNRFSWLSFTTSIDSKPEFDNESIIENKQSSHTDDPLVDNSSHIIPPVIPPKSQHITEHIMLNPLQGKSLYIFCPNNPFRIWAWKCIRSRHMQTLIFFLMVLHWFLLACVPISSNEEKTIFGGQWTHYPIMAIQCFYSIELSLKIVAYGLVIPPKKSISTTTNSNIFRKINIFKKTFTTSNTLHNNSNDTFTTTSNHEAEIAYIHHAACLNSFGNVLDLTAVLSYWADVVVMAYRYPSLSLFKSLGALRPIRLLSLLPGTAVILKSLETSWDLLLSVSTLIVFFLFLFALIGLISFQGVFSRRCYFVPPGQIDWQLVEPPLYCSAYYNGTNVSGPYNVETQQYDYAGHQGFICQSGQMCREDPANNPNYGFLNFDTIFSSFLAAYTFVSLELWTDLMYQTQDADSTVAALYYCLGVYIIAFVLTFLLFAVITSAFARVRALSAVSAFTAKKKEYLVLRDTDGLDDEAMWMYDNAPDEKGGVTRVKLRFWIVKITNSRIFFYFGGFLVLLDMIFMCFRSFYASDQTLNLVDNAETAFTFLFALEIILRMVGATSWMSFWQAKRNLFDLFLVISTCVIQLPMIQDYWAYKYLTIFQICRFYRLFICIPRVRRLLTSALGTGESVLYVMVFLILATALSSTVFMQMFGGDFGEVTLDQDPANKFDTFWEAFISLIVVYTSETWTEVLYNAMASQSGKGSIYAGIALSIYFAFGRYIMSGLYIAVVLENFELSDDYIRHYQIRDFINRHTIKDSDRTETILMKLFKPLYHLNEDKKVHVSQLPANLTAPLTRADLTVLLTDKPNITNVQKVKTSSWIERKFALFYRKIRKHTPFLQQDFSIKLAPIDPLQQDTEDVSEDYETIVAEENRQAKKETTPNVNSLFIFSEHNRIRYLCKKLVGSNIDGQAEKHNIFNWVVMACVFVSILMVILDEPSTRLIRKDTVKQSAFNIIEITLSLLFIVELMIRIIADGFLLTPNSYLRNHWNQLDLCVILLNVVTVFLGSDQAPRGLSTFRSLRILRLIRYFDGIRDIFVALFYALPLMLDALIFTFLVLIPFAIYGMNIFGGLMWLCNDNSVPTRGECIGEFSNNVSGDDGIEVNIWITRVWQNPENGFYSYDNFPAALQHLFSITSTEGWVDSMFSAMSIPAEPDTQPSFDWNSQMIYNAIFYIIFMIISQGTIQLFVGVIIEKFKERNGITTLTTAQRQYSDLQRLIANINPTIKVFRPTSRIKQICYDMVIKKHGKFNRLMMSIIGLNIVVIASEFQSEPTWLGNLQDYFYLAFTLIYVFECIIKLLGLGWRKWIRSKWNWFDFIIATSALILLIFRFALPGLWTVRVERYCLVFAAFRLGEGIDSLQTLYHTIAKSMPSIIQVSAVFMVAMCLFAMLFMELFGLTKYGIYGSAHSNFRDYGNALLLLVRATTGEAWNAMIVDYAVQYPNCVPSSNYLEDDCGSVVWAYFLFDLFYIICTHILMNLFTAVIISNFEYAYETRTRFTDITKADLRMFKHAWADIDTEGVGYIQKEDVAKLLGKLTGPLQIKIYDDTFSVANIIKVSRVRLGEKPRGSTSIQASPKSPGEVNNAAKSSTGEYNTAEMNRLLSKMDVDKVRKRRTEYNLYYREILRTETPKGIPFASVLTIVSYRVVNISTALTLDPLIARLEKIDQIMEEYYLEKAAGFFLTQIQKKRFIHELWKKRDEDEVKKLGVAVTTSPFNIEPSSFDVQDSPINYFDIQKDSKRKSPPVPRIVINNVSTTSIYSSPGTTGSNSVPVSPVSAFSMENQYDPSDSVGGYSLAAQPGTNSISSSPNTDFGNSGKSTFSGALSPYSPIPNLGPASAQGWILVDGNTDMSADVSDGLMESFNHNIWSDMLREENNL